MTLPIVRISPVLCCGTAPVGPHAESVTPAVVAVASVPGQDTLHIETVTLPISVWTNLPFLERLHAFAEPICTGAQDSKTAGTAANSNLYSPGTQDTINHEPR